MDYYDVREEPPLTQDMIEDALYFFDEMEEMDYWEGFYHYFEEN